MPTARLPAVWMRGGTSKGVFFDARSLPADPAARDRLLLRVLGSPDPYGKQIDGLGGASSSTSKVVLVSPSTRPGCDVDYWFGQVAIDRPLIDWTGNCGNLSAAVGPFALAAGMVAAAPAEGLAQVRIWQANLGRHIHAHVPMHDGQVVENGDFELDGVAFAAAEIRLDFLDPAPEADGPAAEAAKAGTDARPDAGTGADTDANSNASPAAAAAAAAASAATAGPGSGLFPTGAVLDTLHVSGLGPVQATCINAGNPCVLVAAAALGLVGTEGQAEVNGRPELLARAEAVRAAGAVAMGLVRAGEDAARTRPGTPKLILLAPPAAYTASDGRAVDAGSVHLLARAFSMGMLHHAVPGTCAIAIGAAAAVPGTLAGQLRHAGPAAAAASGAPSRGALQIGHPSGRLAVEAACEPRAGGWAVTRVSLSRTARRLMEGWVCVPAALLGAIA